MMLASVEAHSATESWEVRFLAARAAKEKAFGEKHGLKRSRRETICLAHLFRKHPCRYYHTNINLPHIPPGSTHGSLWVRDGQAVAYVYQPFKNRMNPDLLEELAEFCRKYKLVYTILEDESFHNPGETTLIMIERASMA